MTTSILSILLLLRVKAGHTTQTNRWLSPCDSTIEVTIRCLPVTVTELQRTMTSMDSMGIMVQIVALQT